MLETASPEAPGVAFDPTMHYAETRAAFARAQARIPPHQDAFCAIAGWTLRIRFAGPAAARLLLPALHHLAIPPVTDPSLTIMVADSKTTGVLPPDAGWRRLGNTHTQLVSTPTARAAYQFESETQSLLHFPTSEGIFWVTEPGRLRYYEEVSPLRALLSWWLLPRGCLVTHGAAIASSAGAVLLAGRGGSGKSTTAVACLEAGLAYLGDDYCAIAPSPSPTVFSLYETLKLMTPPADSPLGFRPPQEASHKAVANVGATHPAQLLRAAPVRAVACLEVAHRERTTVEEISPAAALRALAPSTLLQQPGLRSEALRLMAELVQSVPCRRVRVGTDRRGIAACVGALTAS